MEVNDEATQSRVLQHSRQQSSALLTPPGLRNAFPGVCPTSLLYLIEHQSTVAVSDTTVDVVVVVVLVVDVVEILGMMVVDVVVEVVVIVADSVRDELAVDVWVMMSVVAVTPRQLHTDDSPEAGSRVSLFLGRSGHWARLNPSPRRFTVTVTISGGTVVVLAEVDVTVSVVVETSRMAVPATEVEVSRAMVSDVSVSVTVTVVISVVVASDVAVTER